MRALSTFIKKDFIKNISIVMSGAALAQIITIASSPILTRQYETEAFGLLGIFMAVIGVLATVVTGRYSMAVMLPKAEEVAVHVLIFSILFAVIFSLILVCFLPFSDEISRFLGASDLSPYLLVVPILIFISGVDQSFEDWLSRKKKFKFLTIALIGGAILGNGFKMIYGLLDSGESGLIIGNVIGLIFPVVVYLGSEVKVVIKKLRECFDGHALKSCVFEYRYMPLYRAPKDCINALSQSLPTFILAIFFSASQVGLYLLADRMLRVPGVLIGKAIRKVFYQKAAEIHNNQGGLYTALLKVTVGLALIGALPFLTVILFGPELFSFAFGDAWYGAGVYGRWIAIWMLFAFINVPCVVAIPILALERYFLGYEVLSIVARSLALFFGGYIAKSDVVAIMLFSLSGALLNGLLIIFVLVVAKRKGR